METNTIDLSKYYVGTVMNYNITSRELAVYIPELMPALSSVKYEEYNVPTNNGITLENSSGITLSVKKSNALWIKAENINIQLPDVGSNVIVYFIENNPTLAFWRPFYINKTSKIIASEQYPKSFKLFINNQSFDVNKDDNIQINLPPNYEVLVSEENKTKTFILNDKNTEYSSMKEQLTVLKQNNNYLLSILKRRIINELVNKINTDYSKYSAEVSNSECSELVNKFNSETYPNYINSLAEIYQLISVDECNLVIENIFDNISNISEIKTYYTENNNSDKFNDVITAVNNQINSSLNNFDNIANQNNVYTALTEQILSLQRTVTFTYNYVPTFPVDSSSIPETVSISGQNILVQAELFKVIPTETINFIKTNAEPKYFSLNQSFAKFTEWYMDSLFNTKFSETQTINSNISLYPAFLGVEVISRTVSENNGQYTITFSLQLINSANIEITEILYNSENITENMQIIINSTNRNEEITGKIKINNIEIN